MTVVGTAEIVVHADTAGFPAEVEAGTAPAFAAIQAEADKTALATGMKLEAGTSPAFARIQAIGKKAFIGIGAAAVVAGVEGLKLAANMQTAEASIASAEGTTTDAAKKIGDAFLGTAGKSEFSGAEMTAAFAGVAGQLKEVQGRVLTVAESQKVMGAATSLASAKQIDLKTSTGALATVMQAYGLKADHAAHVSDVLFTASNATGQGVDQLATQLVKARGKLGDTSGSLSQMSGVLVDMTEHGVTGRAAMTGLTSGLQSVEKTAGAVTIASHQQREAFDALSPSLQKLVRSYQSGKITTAEFGKETSKLPVSQAQAVAAFNKATTAISNSERKYKDLGVTVFDTKGKFVGVSSIVDQLAPRFDHMTQAQKINAATTLFGAAAAKQWVAVIDAGPAALDKATKAVAKHGTAEDAAAKQSKTLHGEWETLKATASDIATDFGQVLVPVVLAVGHAFLDATQFVIGHKAVLIALAVFVGGPLTAAMLTFVGGALASMATAWIDAGTAVVGWVATATGAEAEVTTLGGMTVVLGGEMTAMGDATVAAGAEMEGAFAGVGASADAMAGETTAAAAEADGAIADIGAASIGGGPLLAVAGVIAGVVLAIKGLGGEESDEAAIARDSAAAHKAEAASMQTLTKATEDAAQKGLAAKQSTLDLASAKARVNQLLKDGKQGTLEYKDAVVAEEQASLQSIGAHAAYTHQLYLQNKAQTDNIKTAKDAVDTAAKEATQAKQHAAAIAAEARQLAGLPPDADPVKGTRAANAIAAANATAAKAQHALNDQVSAYIRQVAASNDADASREMLMHNANVIQSQYTLGISSTIDALKAEGVSQQTQAKILTDTQKVLATGGSLIAQGASSTRVIHILADDKDAKGKLAELMALAAHIPDAKIGVDAQTGDAKAALLDIQNTQLRDKVVNILESDDTAKAKIAALVKLKIPEKTAKILAQDLTASQVAHAQRAITSVKQHSAAKINADPSQAVAASGQVTTSFNTLPPAAAAAGAAAMEAMAQAIASNAAAAVGAANNAARGVAAALQQVQSDLSKINSVAAGAKHGISDTGDVERGALGQFSGITAFGAKVPAGKTTPPAANPAQAATAAIAAMTAAVNATIHHEQEVTKAEIAAQNKAVEKASAATKAAEAKKVAHEQAMLTTEVADQRKALAERTAAAKTGASLEIQMEKAIQSGSQTKIQEAIAAAYEKHLPALERTLRNSHDKALQKLEKDLVKVHAQAEAENTKILKKEAAAAAATFFDEFSAAGITQAAKIATDNSNAAVQAIQDASKVTLDNVAATGKSGADLVAAQAQTALDVLTQGADAVIAQDQLIVDSDVGGSQTQQAQEAANLAAAQGNAAVAEAQQQATVDLDNALAQAADAAASAAASATPPADTTTPDPGDTSTPPAAPVQNFSFVINGGGMSAQELMNEVGWALKTGALPVAA